MTIASLDLASLLCSRLCHDLLSPVGALSNGLELLAEESCAFSVWHSAPAAGLAKPSRSPNRAR
jgi:hypothetical protein